MPKLRVRITRTTTVMAHFWTDIVDPAERRAWVEENREDLFVLGEIAGTEQDDFHVGYIKSADDQKS